MPAPQTPNQALQQRAAAILLPREFRSLSAAAAAELGCSAGAVNMSASLRLAVDILAIEGVSATEVREGKLAGVFRKPYQGCSAGHPWGGKIGLLWDGMAKRYFAYYDIREYSTALWQPFWAFDVPDDEDPADHAIALIVRRVNRIRGSGSGPGCLLRVTSWEWVTPEPAPRAVREA